MPQGHPDRKHRQRPAGARERRAPTRRGGWLAPVRWLHSVMTRPFRVVWANGGLRLHFVERRERGAEAGSPPASPDPVAALRAELRVRLLAFAPRDAAQVMHHLLLVDEELGRGGWSGVAALPAPVLAQALVQAQRLVKERPSEAVSSVVERLRPLLAAAEQRTQRDERHRDVVGQSQLEVSEATGEEFEASKRSWFGDLPPPAETTEGGEVKPK